MPRGSSAGQPADVEEFVSALLTASRVLMGVAAQSLADLDDTVTLPQFRALVVIGMHESTNLITLAEALDVNASSAMRMIDRLLAAGLVTRSEDPSDRRAVVLALTPSGADLVRRVTGRRRRAISQVVARMSEADRAGLINALSGFAAAAGEPEVAAFSGAAGLLGW